MELKHSINGAGGADISKIRHLRPKQRHFGLSKKKIAFWSLLQKKKSPRASLHSPTTEKMEKKKKKKKEKKKKGKKKPPKMLETRCYRRKWWGLMPKARL